MPIRNPTLSMALGAVALLLVSALGAWAQLQTSGQQACLNAVNKNGAAVARTQGKENLACLKGAGKGTLVGTAQSCLGADAGGKVAKAQGKTTAAEAKSCGTAPSFGYTGAATVNAAARQAELDLVADVYGASLDAAVIGCGSNKAGCTCQQKVSKDIEAHAAAQLATFVACKKSALKAGATSATALADCVDDGATAGSIAQDTKGKISKVFGKLTDDIIKACDGPNVTAGAFPGECDGVGGGGALALCLSFASKCRVCQAINEMDGLFVNCDLFDNGVADATCDSGTGPTPTPTPTATLTPSPTPTFQPGTIVQGFLPRTNGFWGYMAIPGLPGGESLCNATFPGTHVCTVADLQSAEALGELVGASDNMGAVTRFWKIDPTETDLRQCVDAPPNATLRWHYGTAHTLSRGIYRNFSALTGALGTESSTVSCPGTQASVGCCL